MLTLFRNLFPYRRGLYIVRDDSYNVSRIPHQCRAENRMVSFFLASRRKAYYNGKKNTDCGKKKQKIISKNIMIIGPRCYNPLERTERQHGKSHNSRSPQGDS